MPDKRDKRRGDLLPEEVLRVRRVEAEFLSRARALGFREIRTATIEPLHIFTSTEALTPDLLERIYSFLDWDSWTGSRVVLRPECTVSAARYYLEHLRAEGPARLCYMENHFILGGEGAVSERWQCGLEDIGADSPEADFRAIEVAVETLRSVGIGRPYLLLSYPSIVKEYVEGVFGAGGDRGDILTLIKENDFEYVRAHFGGHAGFLALERMLEGRGSDAGFLQNLKALIGRRGRIASRIDRFVKVCALLQGAAIPFEIRFSLSKNFEYYTGIQFEILSEPKKTSSREVLSAGGRYDNLIGTLGGIEETIPAVGCALYIKNVIARMEAVREGRDVPAPKRAAPKRAAPKTATDATDKKKKKKEKTVGEKIGGRKKPSGRKRS